MRRGRPKTFVVVSSCLMLMACSPGLIRPYSTAPLASPTLKATALNFASREGQAVVYVYRVHAMPDRLAQLVLDGRPLGYTISGSFARLELNPGEHELLARLESWTANYKTFRTEPKLESRFTFQAKTGECLFIRQAPYPWSWAGRLDFAEVPQAEARHELTRGKYELLALP